MIFVRDTQYNPSVTAGQGWQTPSGKVDSAQETQSMFAAHRHSASDEA